ncbi:ABC transporter permease [Actinorhabdospora filicis]|uniref:ABC transporter permease n=1 Tax=Actinorhabdospora filicis TaxID=1785913 RepID=A0A9W6SK20_9ACTN|nr:ABC transporter permease [Actinorhabdospora filicis]GLZ77064.1 ABC transporter permease [Actinorhabdospora filicis]
MTVTTARADGGAAGYSPGRTLTFGTEFRRQLTRRRTQWTLALLALLPVVLLLAFKIGGDGESGGNDGSFAAMADLGTAGAANFTLFAMLVSSTFLMVVVFAMFCGDTVAGEASWGSLRYLLAVPVPRGRLLSVKLAVALAYCVLAMTVLTGMSLLVGGIVYGWGPLRAPLGGEVASPEAIWRVLAVAGYLTVTLMVVAGLAFLLSVLTDAPLGAVGGAVLLYIVSNILDAVTALGDLRDVLPTRYTTAWLGLLSPEAQTDDMVRGIVVALVYGAVFASAAFWRFTRKDVTS